MANTIQVKRSATPSAVPTTGQLALGEIAVNTYDGKVYIKKDNGTASIVEVGASGGGGLTSLNSQTGATQTFAVGTAGTDFAVSSSTNVHTFDLPNASATARGVITTGTQTIAGQKNFTSSLGVNEASPGAQLQITSSAAATKGLIVKTAASASANPIEMQDSTGTALMYVNTVGALVANGAYLGRGANNISTNLSVGAAVNFSVGGDQNVVVGIGATTNSFRNVIIGRGATANSQDNVVVGANGVVGTGGGNILIAAQSGDTRWSSNNCVVGSWSTCSASVGSVALFGYGSSASGSNAVAVGRSASAGADALALGRSASAAANCLDMRFGSGNPSRIAGDSNGQIGINEGTPGAQLQVTSGAAARKGLIVKAAASASANIIEAQNSSGSALLSVDSSGKLGIGTAPNTKLDVADAFQDFTGLSPSAKTVAIFRTTDSATANYGGNILLGGNYTGTSYYPHAGIKGGLTASGSLGGYLALYTTEDTSGLVKERMRIDKVGNVGIGVTNPTYQLQLSTDSAAKLTTTTWSTTSDARVKKNVEPYEKGLTEICQLRPITYDFNGLGGMAEGPGGISVIAQEIQPIFPECVGTYKAKLHPTDSEETDILNFNGHAILFALINSVKELRAKLDTLEQRLTLLETSS